MIDFIPLALLLFFACGLTVPFRCRMERALPAAALAVTAILYLSSLAGALYAGFFLCIALSLAGGVLFVRAFKREGKTALSRVLTPGLVFYLAAMAFSYLITIGRVLFCYDEFTHWGLAIRNLYLYNALPGCCPSTVLFQKYPPLASLTSYYFVRFSPVFSEAALYRGLHAMGFALMTPAFSALSLTKKDLPRCLLLGLALGLLPVALMTANAYITLYVDCLMGLLFGYLLYALCAIANGDAEPLALPSVFLCALALPLVKDAGLGLVFLAYLVFLVRTVVSERAGRKKRIRMGAIAPVSALIGFLSWRLYCQAFDLTNGSLEKVSRFSFGALGSLVSGTAESGAGQVFHGFLKMFLEPVGTSPLSPSTLVLILLFLLLGVHWIFRADRAARRPRIALVSALCGGFFLYALGVLGVHLFSFSVEEALLFGSFHRYLHTYLLGAMLCLVFLEARESVFRPVAPIVLVAVLLAFITPKELFRLNPAFPRDWRKDAPALYADRLDSPSDRVLYVTDTADQFDYYEAHYSATPAFVDLYGDAFLTAEALKPYSFLYLHSASADFLSESARLFAAPPKERTLYRIDRSGGEMKLVAAH